MKKSKTVLSEHFNEFRLSEDDLHRLQDCLLHMFVDIKDMCDENGINYMMSGGSCLGAVRHKGFIPWDDDIDIMMTRKEYEKFRRVFAAKKDSKYLLAEPTLTEHYYYKMPKIYNKETEYVSIREEGIGHFNMVSIDIFIIENAPEHWLRRKIKTQIYNLSFHAASMCLDYLFMSKPIEAKMREDTEVREYFEFRRKMGSVFSHIGGIGFYLKLCERIANYPKETSLVCVPSALSYEREMLPRETFDEIAEGEFCGYKVNLPAGYDAYLSNLYKDYMKIPPAEKREIHVVYRMNI